MPDNAMQSRRSHIINGAAMGGVLSALAALLAIGLSIGLGSVFGWSDAVKAIVWVISCLVFLTIAISVSVARGRRMERSPGDTR